MKSILVILNDGKYIIDKDKLIICQSNVSTEILKSIYPRAIVNPLGDWTTEGNVFHYGFIEKFIEELVDKYNIK